jgi:hypothetical protein
MNWNAGPSEGVGQELPPQVEAQLAMMAAQAMQQFMQQQQAQQQAAQQQQQPQQENPQQVEAMKQAAFQAEEQRKQSAFEAEQARKNSGLAAEVDREDAKSGISPELIKQADEFLKQTGLQMSPRELAVMSKALGRPFAEVVQAVSRLMMGGSGAGPAPIAQGMNNQQTQRFM